MVTHALNVCREPPVSVDRARVVEYVSFCTPCFDSVIVMSLQVDSWLSKLSVLVVGPVRRCPSLVAVF